MVLAGGGMGLTVGDGGRSLPPPGAEGGGSTGNDLVTYRNVKDTSNII